MDMRQVVRALVIDKLMQVEVPGMLISSLFQVGENKKSLMENQSSNHPKAQIMLL